MAANHTKLSIRYLPATAKVTRSVPHTPQCFCKNFQTDQESCSILKTPIWQRQIAVAAIACLAWTKICPIAAVEQLDEIQGSNGGGHIAPLICRIHVNQPPDLVHPDHQHRPIHHHHLLHPQRLQAQVQPTLQPKAPENKNVTNYCIAAENKASPYWQRGRLRNWHASQLREPFRS